MGEAPDLREQEDCPSPEACDRACDQHGTAEKDTLDELVERIRSQADIASRAGQYGALHSIADDLAALGERVFPPAKD